MSEKDAELFAIIQTATTLACCLEATAHILEDEQRVPAKKSVHGKHTQNDDDDDDDEDYNHTIYMINEPIPYIDTKSDVFMDEKCFKTILNFIKRDKNIRMPLTAEHTLSATLQYLATGDIPKSIQLPKNLSILYLTNVIIETCEAINKKMLHKYLSYPTEQRYSQVAHSFEEWAQFPNCIGAIDTKHIQFNAQQRNSHIYLNKQGFHSLVLFTVSDIFGKFLLIDVGNQGELDDVEVLENSILKSILHNSKVFLPDPIKLEDDKLMPFVFIADHEFPCTADILTPYQTDLTVDKEIFNERLFRAMDGSHRALKALTTRFGVLRKKIMHNHVKTATIIKTCCILHNFLIENNSLYMQNITIEEDNTCAMETNVDCTSTTPEGEHVRKLFKEYFYKKEKDLIEIDEKPDIIDISKNLFK